jgi:hypothetical protein
MVVCLHGSLVEEWPLVLHTDSGIWQRALFPWSP